MSNNIIVKVANVDSCSPFTLTLNAAAQGYVIMDKDAPLKACPLCKEEQSANASKGKKPPSPGALRAAYHNVMEFINKDTKLRMAACPCGYRKVEVRGYPKVAHPDDQCKAIKANGSPCTNTANDSGYCGVHKGQTALPLVTAGKPSC